MKRIHMERKRKSNYGSIEWVQKLLANENLGKEDYRRFLADLHRTRNYKGANLLKWALKKRFNGDWEII